MNTQELQKEAVKRAEQTLAGHPNEKAMPDLALTWLASRAETHAKDVIALAGATRPITPDGELVEKMRQACNYSKLIGSIKPNKANFDYIANSLTGEINGTLALDIERALEEATQACAEAATRHFSSEIERLKKALEHISEMECGEGGDSFLMRDVALAALNTSPTKEPVQ